MKRQERSMDREEAYELKQSPYANTADVKREDRVLLPGITGREDDLGADPAPSSAADIDQPVVG
jgi:hypothetical protein